MKTFLGCILEWLKQYRDRKQENFAIRTKILTFLYSKIPGLLPYIKVAAFAWAPRPLGPGALSLSRQLDLWAVLPLHFLPGCEMAGSSLKQMRSPFPTHLLIPVSIPTLLATLQVSRISVLCIVLVTSLYLLPVPNLSSKMPLFLKITKMQAMTHYQYGGSFSNTGCFSRVLCITYILLQSSK